MKCSKVVSGSQRAVTRIRESGLHVLAARDPSAPRRTRGPWRMAGLLRELRDQFERVIVDCPAILPLDGGAFVEHADRIAFVIAWDEHRSRAGRAGLRPARQPASPSWSAWC